MSYRHITTEQRYEIDVLKRQGYSNGKIAGIIGKDRSSIGRELRRNGSGGRYGGKIAGTRATKRRRVASSRRHRLTPEIQALIDQKLRQQQWSPEQISFRLRQEGYQSLSPESIYLYIWRDKRDGGDLYTHLRQQKKRRKR